MNCNNKNIGISKFPGILLIFTIKTRLNNVKYEKCLEIKHFKHQFYETQTQLYISKKIKNE